MQLLSCMRVIKSLVFNGPLNTSWTVVNPMVLFINIFRKYQILTVNHFAVEYCVRIRATARQNEIPSERKPLSI